VTHADPVPAERRAALMSRPGFGRIYTDHMMTLTYRRDRGWGDAHLQPYGPVQLDPAAMVLHYGQAIFEGLKAYRQADGGVALFRPEANAMRFNRSAHRLAMPEMPADLFIACLKTLVEADREWVPSATGQSLYLRPLLIASEPMLGVRPADEYLFLLIASPVEPFFSAERRAVRVWVSHEYVRATPGGTGDAKCAGNYAAGLRAQLDAEAHECDQVVWLDAADREWVDEMGGMNLFFVRSEDAAVEVCTPELNGTLLAGITRDSLLKIAEDEGFIAREANISVSEWRGGCRSGEITEVFACGTAAVVAPVGEVRSSQGSWIVGNGRPGPVTVRLRQQLLAIQHGEAHDPYGWVHRVE
jgi:branched-chain amino acid aminotransferase